MSFAVDAFAPQMTALDDLERSGDILLISNTPLRNEIADWQAALNLVRRIEFDLLTYRNGRVFASITTNHSWGAAAQNIDPEGRYIVDTRFKNDYGAMAQDRELDNMLAGINVARVSLLSAIQQLEQSTKDLIDEIEQHE